MSTGSFFLHAVSEGLLFTWNSEQKETAETRISVQAAHQEPLPPKAAGINGQLTPGSLQKQLRGEVHHQRDRSLVTGVALQPPSDRGMLEFCYHGPPLQVEQFLPTTEKEHMSVLLRFTIALPKPCSRFSFLQETNANFSFRWG